ncbi:MAG TPA: hypothetical protein VD788_17375 [Candidatus Polarisedimenticolaceae bacterium]|nr:hypothetical protein [Candidatus Polarisedimenticolaceae bacterium]
MSATYRIPDEPRPSTLSRFAVQPFWPLLAVMFGGSWLSWPWFVFNGFAIGSPTRKKELALAAAGFAGNVVLALGVGIVVVRDLLPGTVGPYLALLGVVWRLGVSYLLFNLQSRTFGLYVYYGGVVQNGTIFLVAGYLLGRTLLPRVVDAVPLLRLVI